MWNSSHCDTDHDLSVKTDESITKQLEINAIIVLSRTSETVINIVTS